MTRAPVPNAGPPKANSYQTHTALMNRLFHTAPLDAASWLYVFAVGLAAWCIVEFEKWLRRIVTHVP